MIDDVGWNDVGYHGSSISTPHMDTLAKEGTKLENYYVAHLCSPSRGMFLTGKHMIHLGMEGGIIMPFERKCLPVNEATIAQELKLKNYSTHAIGKWHVGYYKKACLPNNRGFDTFFGIIGGCADHYTHKNTHWWELYRNNISIAQEYQGHYSTDLYAREATNVIRNHDASKPMFMYLAFQAAHLPLQAPRKYIDMYSNIEDPDRRVYAAMVTCMDDAIGNVVDQLREAGLWNNTVLIVSTDNGGAKISGNNWPLKGSKASLWEGGVRGVAFVTSPFLADHVRGTSNHQLMHVTDWFPTMLHVAGVYSDVIKSMTLDGVNQWNTISENRQTERNDVLINLNVNRKVKHVHYEEPWLDNEHFDVRIKSALRLGNWKLLTGSQVYKLHACHGVACQYTSTDDMECHYTSTDDMGCQYTSTDDMISVHIY
ncbi:arylsulfatase B-like [Saccoglossus kowalevskii]|uniref:Arylsulfatase B-like n=1 Tax=Saccoglossus kowalevskii TaxID=10224 RepID=A0ABM0LVS9_SACKO|nr:PREDICTED: arylsulfatase B-like [Saccoglossus kowalevskii]